MKITTKRIYESATTNDGTRILVDRLWPRGVKKENARIDFWAKELAPSNELRKWFQHDHEKWEEFRTRYWAELDAQPSDAMTELKDNVKAGRVTFVFGSKEEDLNNARALKEYLGANNNGK
jgi:uncharacterized protein YeaO (DUF488 family)